MKPNTLNTINLFNDEITIIKIAGMDISELLDLERFKKIKEINCASNTITQIINFPNPITKINCSNNKIKELNNLPVFCQIV